MLKLPGGVMEEFIDAARRVEWYGLIRCSSGNLSARFNGDRMLITPTSAWMEDLKADQIAVCNISDAAPLNDLNPSAETPFHAGILRERPDVQAVLHFQSPSATVLACSGGTARNYDVIPEIPFYIGPIAEVPYAPPGSTELSKLVIGALKEHDLVVLRNHGQVVVGDTLLGTIQKACFFELACDILLRGGLAVSPIPAQHAAELHALRAKHDDGNSKAI